MAGWNLPPGCTDADIERAYGGEGPCAVCGQALEACVCPECGTCGAQGDPKCYADHGLRLSKAQEIARSQVREAQLIMQIEEEKAFRDQIASSPDDATFDYYELRF
jgi:hypothetical protein